MSFDTFGLSAELLRAVADQGYLIPTPIQQLAIPAILRGNDILGRAQTGTGKTAGFALPVLHRLAGASRTRDRRPPIRTLILTPTRELAVQVQQSVRTYGRYLPLCSTVVYGGVGFRPQAQTLRRGVDILVATPGRLLDHVSQGTVDLSKVEILVLDEGDRMLDMGFIDDIKRILSKLPAKRQNLLFSATWSPEIQRLADSLLNRPARIEVEAARPTADGVAQIVHPVDQGRKSALLCSLIEMGSWKKTLVFTRTKRGADRLTRHLTEDGIGAAAIHSGKSQGVRTRNLADFKKGSVSVLVATDIAARGLDIEQIRHVVNFDLPYVAQDYVHRIGRTARAGNTGNAVSLVSTEDAELLSGIERLLGNRIPKQFVAGFEPRRMDDHGSRVKGFPRGRRMTARHGRVARAKSHQPRSR
ncbi:MAG: DEAD/DEAH box helicase [Vicinamibacteria bacterium]